MSDPARAALAALAERVPAGVLVADARGSLVLANARACAVLGVRDADALRAQWDATWSALASQDPAHGGANVRTLPGGRMLRTTAEALPDGSGTLFLLEDPAHPDALHRAIMQAARATRQEQQLAGFLHDLNGPLNNFNLTLALLEAALARGRAAAPADAPAAFARAQRHAELLQAESRRVLEWSRTVAGAMMTPEVAGEIADIAALLPELARTLRHLAALQEVTVDAAPAPAPLRVVADPWYLRLALLDVASALTVHAPPGARIALSAEPDGEAVRVRFAAPVRGETAGAITAFAASACVPDDWIDLCAARLHIDALGGCTQIAASADGTLRVVMRLPQARAQGP